MGTLIAYMNERPQEADVNRDRLEGKWKQVSGRLREQWGLVTRNRLSVVAGRHNQLAGRIQETYGIYHEEAQRELKKFRNRNRDWDASSR